MADELQQTLAHFLKTWNIENLVPAFESDVITKPHFLLALSRQSFTTVSESPTFQEPEALGTERMMCCGFFWWVGSREPPALSGMD